MKKKKIIKDKETNNDINTDNINNYETYEKEDIENSE